MSLETHINNLENRKATLERKAYDLKYYQATYDAMLLDVQIYEAQIERAKRENLDGFDEGKYNKKRNNKCQTL